MPTTAITVRPANAPANQPPLVFEREFTVGRRPGSGIVVENTTIVSGTHLRVRPTDQGWLIELVSQTNGMLVDGVDTRGPVLVTRPVRVQLSNASGPVFTFVPQPTASPVPSSPVSGSMPMPPAPGRMPAPPGGSAMSPAPGAGAVPPVPGMRPAPGAGAVPPAPGMRPVFDSLAS